jgi:hypothetical protein
MEHGKASAEKQLVTHLFLAVVVVVGGAGHQEHWVKRSKDIST